MKRDAMLLRRYRDGESAIDGFLDDYAFLTLALLDLYETAFRSGRSSLGPCAWPSGRWNCSRIASTADSSARAGGQGRSGAAPQGRLRRRGAFRQFRDGAGAAAAGADDRPRGFPRERRNATLAGLRLAPAQPRRAAAAADAGGARCSRPAGRWKSCWRAAGDPERRCWRRSGGSSCPTRWSCAAERGARRRCPPSTASPRRTSARTMPASCPVTDATGDSLGSCLQ